MPTASPTEPKASEIAIASKTITTRAAEAGLDLRAGEQPHRDVGRGLEEAERQRPGELAGDQGGGMDRRQLQAVEEAALVVLGEVLAGADHREDTRLDEGEGEGEGDVGVGREAREGRWPT